MAPKGQRADYDIPLDEGLAKYEDASEKARERAEKYGLQVEREPPEYEDEIYDGRLPSDYANFNLDQLSTLLSVTTEWAGYVEGIFWQVKAEKRNLDNQLKLAKAKVRKTKSGNKEDKDDATLSDSRYVDVAVRYEECDEFLAIVEANYLAAKRDREAVSRLATMRGQQMEHSSRVGSVGRGGGGRSSPRRAASRSKR